MKRFDYEAKDLSTGKIVKASVQAESENAAAKLLLSQGFTPHSIKQADQNRSIFAKLSERITTKDRVVFTRQLATLIGAGLPLTQSLRTVRDQTDNKHFQAILDDIIASVEGGKSMADSFSQHKEVFDTIFLALVRAGEASGTLDQSLRRIATQQEKDAATMSKIRGALTYPIIVLFVIMAVIVFMLVTVVPQVEQLYADLHKSLPFLTQIMVNAANTVRLFGWLLIILAGIGVYFFMQFIKTETGIRFKDTFKLNVPLFKGMFRKLYMARFARTGQTLLSTGVAMLDMLEIAQDSVNNTLVGDNIKHAAERVRGGKSLSSSLQKEEYILPLVPQMISIGEQSGKIDDMLGKTAQVYEDELDEEIQAISTAIEPLLMVLLAVVAGGMVGAILFPIYSLVSSINL